MAGIATYVFLDLETTGMPREELNKTRITELSMLVVKREHILDTRAGMLPRVQHKLTMCFNPGRMIYPGATKASGLDNELLEHEAMFDMNVFNTINSFLNCQKKPVCLIAENGFCFDFPILKNHFVKLNATLDEDIMCADSLYAYYDLNKTQNSVGNGVLHKIDKQINDNSKNFESASALQCNDTINSNMQSPVFPKVKNEEITRSSKQKHTVDELLISDTEDKEVYSPLSKQRQNERTPSAKRYEKTPITPKTMKSVKRKIFYEGNSKPKESHKLKNMHERVLGCRAIIPAHRAENDCIMAAELSTSKVEKFVEWIDNNHCAFSEVKPMRLGIPLGD